MVIDPVCGMQLNEEDAVAVSDYEGKTYYFCSEICQDEFAEDPEQFVTTGAEEDTMVYGHSGME